MIYNTHEPMPQPILPRSTYQSAPPCACGGRIVAQIVPLWRQRFPGEVEYRCDACRTVETAPQRAAKERDYEARIAALGASRRCKRAGCRRSVDGARMYCGKACSDRDMATLWREREREQVTPPSLVTCNGPGCTQPVKQNNVGGRKRLYCSPNCNKRRYLVRRKARAA